MEFHRTRRVLNVIWYSTLPGVFILFTAIIHFAMFANGQTGVASDALAGMIPWILAAVTVGGFGLALFFKQNFLAKRAITMAMASQRNNQRGGHKQKPDQQLTALVMTQLGVSDAPCIVGLAFYAMTGWEWIAAGIIVYAFLASALFKPDFDRLYALLNGSPTY